MNSIISLISKKAVALLCVITAAMCLVSCSHGSDTLDISMYDLSKAMLASSDKFGDMSYVSSDDSDKEKLFKNVSDMDYSKVDKFFISYATDGSKNADEIVVIQLKSNDDVTVAKDSLNKHLEYRKSLYATYMPSQSSKLLKAKVIAYSNIVCLIVADDVGSAEDSFYKICKQ